MASKGRSNLNKNERGISTNGQVNQNYTQHYTTLLTFQEGDKEDLLLMNENY